jgi:hypothetical protein
MWRTMLQEKVFQKHAEKIISLSNNNLELPFSVVKCSVLLPAVKQINLIHL